MPTLRDMYEPEELPTRPDNPRAAARLCKHCGKAYGEHLQVRPSHAQNPAPDAACRGLRRGYEPEAHSNADLER